MFDSAATLTLDVRTTEAIASLQALTQAAVNAKSSLAGIGKSSSGGNFGADIRQGMQSLLAEVKLMNQHMVDSAEHTAKRVSSVRESAERSDAAKIKAFRRSFVRELTRDYQEQLKQEAAFMKEWNSAVLAQAKQKEHAQTLMHKVAVAERLEVDRAAAMESRKISGYVGSIGHLGGYATATSTAPIKLAAAEASAATKLLSQRNAELASTSTATARAIEANAVKYGTLSGVTTKAANSQFHAGQGFRYAHDAARGLSGALGNLWMTYGNIPVITTFFAIATGIKSAVKESTEFEKSLVFIAAIAPEAEMSVKGMSDAILNVAKGSIFKPTEVVEGFRFLITAGFTAKESTEALAATLRLATVGEVGMAEAGQVMQQTLHAYNLEASMAGYVTDVITVAAAKSASTVSDMSQAMRQAITVAGIYKQSLESTSLALMLMANVGIKGTAAGTAYKNLMAELGNPPTKGAREQIKALGFDILKSAGDGKVAFKQLNEIIEELSEKTKGMSERMRLDVISKITNERSAKALSTMLSIPAETIRDMDRALKSAAGFATLAEEMNKLSLGNMWKQMVSAFDQAFIKNIDGATFSLKQLIQALTNLANSEGFQQFIQAVGGGLRFVTAMLTENGAAVGSLIAAYAGIKVLGGVVGLLTSHWTKLSSATLAARAAISGMVVAQSVVPIQRFANATGQASTAMLGAATSASNARSAYSVLAPAAATTGARLAGVAAAGLSVASGLAVAISAIWALKSAYDYFTSDGSKSDPFIFAVEQRTKALVEATKKNTAEMLELRKGTSPEIAALLSDFESSQRTLTEGLEVSHRKVSALSDQLAAKQAEIRERHKRGVGLGFLGMERNAIQSELAEAKSIYAAQQSAAKANYKALKDNNASAIALGVERNKKLAEAASKSQGLAGPGLPEEVRGLGKSWLPKYVQEFEAEVANYASSLQNIGRIESDALAILKAKHDAGLVEESTYLAKRNAVRKQADSSAASELKAFYNSQVDLATDAMKAYQDIEARMLKELAKPETSKNNRSEAVRSEGEAAMQRQVNIAAKAMTDIDKAHAELESRAQSRTQQGVLDALGGMKERYGDTDEQIRNAQEMVRVMSDQTSAMKALTTRERDKNLVAMEGDQARLQAFINEMKWSSDALIFNEAEIVVLEKKLAVLEDLQKQYEDQKKEQMALDSDWLHGVQKGLQKYLEVTVSASKLADEAVSGAFKSMEDSIVEFTKTGRLSFSGLIDSMIENLVRLGTQQLVLKPLAEMLMGSTTGGSGGLIGSLAGMFGGGTTSASMFASQQAGFSAADLAGWGGAFAKGGTPPGISAWRNQIVDKPTFFAKGGSVMGEAGPEAIMPLTRTSSGELGVKMSDDSKPKESSQPVNHFHINVNGVKDEGGLKRSAGQIAAAAAGMVRSAQRFS